MDIWRTTHVMSMEFGIDSTGWNNKKKLKKFALRAYMMDKNTKPIFKMWKKLHNISELFFL